MALFDKISNNLAEFDLFSSISREIVALIENRNDPYWCFDFEKGRLFGIHEAFKYPYTSSEFIKNLKDGIKAFEPRFVDLEINVEKGSHGVNLIIMGKIRNKKEIVDFPRTRFFLSV